ncbi:MAG: DUF4360 domain-containing protein [bacterium]
MKTVSVVLASAFFGLTITTASAHPHSPCPNADTNTNSNSAANNTSNNSSANNANTNTNSSANANDPVYFKAPINFAGTGCPAGSIAVTGENTDTLSILFDKFDAGKESASGKRRAACSFAVPVHVPQGYQVSVLTADWQGYAEGKAELKRKYFFAGEPNVPTQINRINSPAGDDFLFQDGRIHESLSISACGEDKVLRINSSIIAKGSQSYAAIDTADLKNTVQFQLQWQRCN